MVAKVHIQVFSSRMGLSYDFLLIVYWATLGTILVGFLLFFYNT